MATERNAYLDEACGDDKKLREEVEELLKAHYEAEQSFLKSPPGIDGTLIDSPLTEGPGTKIGRYKLLQLIGEGGFGVVYMAEQEEPIRRKVALKIIKLGMDTKQVIARFEAERQALALMDHPNIARVLDAGATETGRPYFVMELVKGMPITAYCDKNNLNTRQRLELFIEVCKAVQHAHQKGIIHRDIKPTNVLVTLHDGRPVPKIIDFGIAKATQQRLTEKTLFTEFQQFIGTPEYMSPEQAEMSELDIDTRSDIYSLGVLLYEQLTGTTPFAREQLLSAPYDQMRKMISETDPPKPSTRLSTLGEPLTYIAQHRNVEPAQLCKIVRGDLDWIVMKALEKDRTRRYDTANEFAQDIGRHLGDEPVVAGPPSAIYRVHKFTRRHRVGVAAGLSLAASLVIGFSLAITGFVQASQEQTRTKAALQRAGMNFAMASEAVEEMTRLVMEQMAGIPGMEQVQRDLLQKAQAFYQRFLQENNGDLTVREEIGEAYRELGDIYERLGQYGQAEQACRKSINVFQELVADFPHVPAYWADLAHTHVGLADVLVLQETSRAEEAEYEYRQAIEIFEQLAVEFPNEPDWQADMAGVLMCAGRLLEDSDRLKQAVDILENLTVGFPDVPEYRCSLVMAAMDYGRVLDNAGQPEAAEQAYAQSEINAEELVTRFPNLYPRPFYAYAFCGPASVDYNVRITTVGDYQLYVRCAGHDLSSDSFYTWIGQLCDGLGGEVADWYRYSPDFDADFGTNPWYGSAAFERTDADGHETAALWSIAAPGDYTIHFTVREDGAAIDAFAFQLAGLSAPEGRGPEESQVTEDFVFLEVGGQVVAEAEDFSSRVPSNGNWFIIPGEDPGDIVHLNFRGTGYVQALPDRTLVLDYGIRAVETDPENAEAEEVEKEGEIEE